MRPFGTLFWTHPTVGAQLVGTDLLDSDFINTKILECTNNTIFSNNTNIYFNTNSLREEIIINNNLSNTTMFDISY